MSKTRLINTKFWDDNYITQLDPVEKLIFLYFLTNPLTDICGIYEISLKRMAFDTGIDADTIPKILDRFKKAGKIFYIDGWIYIKNFSKNQNYTSKKVKAGIARNYEGIPEEIRKKINTLSIPYRYPMDTQSTLRLRLRPKLKPKLRLKPKPINTSGELAAGDPINLLICNFKMLNPSYKTLFRNKTQRSACERLLKEHGIEKLQLLIAKASECATEDYAPVITTPLQLETKMAQLLRFYQRKEIIIN